MAMPLFPACGSLLTGTPPGLPGCFVPSLTMTPSDGKLDDDSL